jgi:hypothetical protein
MNDGWGRMRQNIVMPILKYSSETGSETLLNTTKLLHFFFGESKFVDSIKWRCYV